MQDWQGLLRMRPGRIGTVNIRSDHVGIARTLMRLVRTWMVKIEPEYAGLARTVADEA